MATPSITIKKGFQHAAEFFGPGREAALLASTPAPTPEQLANWQKRGLIETDGAEAPVEKSGDTALVLLLKPYVGETGENEDEVETLVRIIRERDEAEDALETAEQKSSPLEAQLVEALRPYVGETGLSEGAVDVLNRVIEERARYATELTETRLRLEQAETVQGVTIETSTPAPADEKDQTAANGQAQTEAQGQVTETKLTAEELTKVTSSPRAAIAILEAGFDTKDKLRAATDADLEKLPDLAGGRIKKLRDFLAA